MSLAARYTRQEMGAGAAGGSGRALRAQEPVELDLDLELGEKFEDWLICNMEGRAPERLRLYFGARGEAEGQVEEATVEAARRFLGTGGGRSKGVVSRRESGSKRLWIEQREDLVAVRMLDRQLIKETLIEEVGAELGQLVASGWSRMVLDFQGVERCASQVLALLVRIGRQCEQDGGMLRVAGLHAELAEALEILGLEGKVRVYGDVSSAVEDRWPARAPRPLPVGVLSQLMRESHMSKLPHLKVFDGEPEQAGKAGGVSGVRVKLLRQRTSGEGEQELCITRWPFVIGRGEECDLPMRSVNVSRRHARLEEGEDGAIWLRDLGSLNGTMVSGERVQNSVVRVMGGEEVVIGPVRFRIEISRESTPWERNGRGSAEARAESGGEIGSAEELIASWLQEEPTGELAESEEGIPLAEMETKEVEPAEEAAGVTGRDSSGTLRYEVIEGVLLVRPTELSYEDELAVGSLRTGLLEFLERPDLPRQVVLSLAGVMDFSSRAVGVVVAHQMRLERMGGSLRLAQPSPVVQAALQRIHLPMLVSTFDTIDDAVITVW
jgi:anti-anti-sigma regulatory factor/pSer/pThr/pTyr-binding forkhead associated (FHA) protein